MLSKRTAGLLTIGLIKINGVTKKMKKAILLFILVLCCNILGGCEKNNLKNDMQHKESIRQKEAAIKNKNKEDDEKWEKGYNLPVDKKEAEEAGDDCRKIMESIHDLYNQAKERGLSNDILDDKTIIKMQNKVKNTGYPVTTMLRYSDMKNYKSVIDFLTKCKKGEEDTIVIYKIRNDGGIGRYKFIFDGEEMYLLSSAANWNDNGKADILYTSYDRIKKWKYTDKGWFCYELCVPEYPEVTEMVDGSNLIRVKPYMKRQRELSKKCVSVLGYQGNNLLCSNWDTAHLDKLDYNGLYEYLYVMKYNKQFPNEKYSGGIPKDEFEELIMEYIPITADKIRKYAVYNEKKQVYGWAILGCLNYTLTFFRTSMPEVTDIKENEDGTVTLTVDAVCEMVLCDDAVITHELTVKFAEDGSFQYISNKILNDGIQEIPDYEYRIVREQ
ncbi:MAG: DUF6070 family protein [Lachnospiraceae bacterium]|nr:DUF6070 family protein [Lachnospiraceae bacterium]